MENNLLGLDILMTFCDYSSYPWSLYLNAGIIFYVTAALSLSLFIIYYS
jgi:hypothetical protein